MAATQKERDRYRQKLKGLRRMSCESTEPRYGLVKMAKRAPESANKKPLRSAKIAQLYKKIKRSGQYDNSKWKIEAEEKWEPYFDSILAYIRHNGEYPTKPEISLGGSEDNSDSDSDESDDDDDDKWKSQVSVLARYDVSQHAHIPSLNGQRGLRAKVDIPKGTVLGRYVGVEYFADEWQDIYGGTRDEALHAVYAFNTEIDDPSNDDQAYKTVTDAIAYDDSTLLLYINDCRQNMVNNEVPSSDDEPWWNVEFVRVKLNGWPAIFVVTRREVSAGVELLGWYGHDYHVACRDKNRWQQMRGIIQHYIDEALKFV